MTADKPAPNAATFHLGLDGAEQPRVVQMMFQPRSPPSSLGSGGWTQEVPDFAVSVQLVQPVQGI